MNCAAEWSFGATIPNECQIADVEIDPDIGAVEFLMYTTVDNMSDAIDHVSVEGQVHGSVLQRVG